MIVLRLLLNCCLLPCTHLHPLLQFEDKFHIVHPDTTTNPVCNCLSDNQNPTLVFVFVCLIFLTLQYNKLTIMTDTNMFDFFHSWMRAEMWIRLADHDYKKNPFFQICTYKWLCYISAPIDDG